VSVRKNKPEHCELCKRAKPLSFHHLIPRKNHRRNYFKRTFDKWEMVTRGAWLCRLCHRKLHKTYSEQELGKNLNTLEAIKQQPEMQVFLEWAKKQK